VIHIYCEVTSNIQIETEIVCSLRLWERTLSTKCRQIPYIQTEVSAMQVGERRKENSAARHAVARNGAEI
jgi:hypothetical protein